jgi:hypothetical protein
MDREQQHRLLQIVEQLSPRDQAAVGSFAEFLLSRTGSGGTGSETVAAAPVPIPEIEPIPRPADEKVVAAVKRLSRTYFMLDKKKMLGVTSDLVTQHVIQGREASEVIDDLERIFDEHYRLLLKHDD